MNTAKRKGIVLAGGFGTRLQPCTNPLSKQSLPVYDKPMIYYPISTLANIGIEQILLISSPEHINIYQQMLGDGSSFGLSIDYAIQSTPAGIAQALLISRVWLAEGPCALILGDNIFVGETLHYQLQKASSHHEGATIFTYQVSNPESYGVVALSSRGILLNIVEKPSVPPSNHAVVGLYFYDSKAPAYAAGLQASRRGELEITDLNRIYLRKKNLKAIPLEGNVRWFDAGTHDALLAASVYIRSEQKRTGQPIGLSKKNQFKMLDVA